MEHDMSLLQDFAFIMMVAAIVGVLFRKLNQPVVLGYLIAGYIVGPHSPPWVIVENESVIREFADFGIVLLMFGLGLEFSIDRLRRVGMVAVIGAGTEIAIMIAIGYFLGRAFGWSPMDAIFLGAALSISSTAIIVKVLHEMGRMHEESSRVMFGILVVEDFFAVGMMTVMAGVGRSGEINVADVGQLVFSLVLFTIVSLALGLRLFARFVDFVARMGSKEVLTVLIIGSAFGMALFAEQLGLSIAAGAFIIGAITAESMSAKKIHLLSEPIRDIFGAIFFVTMGMLIDVRVLAEYVLPVIAIVAAVILGKIAACYIGVFLSGYGPKTAFRVGVGMSQVGEFSLVISKIGTETGAASAFMQPLMAVVSGVTALTTPYLIRSGDAVAAMVTRRIPGVIRRRSDDVEFWSKRIHALIAEESDVGRRARTNLALMGVNVMIISAFLLTGNLLVGEVRDLTVSWPRHGSTVLFLIGFGTIVLCAPPFFALWRSMRNFFDAVLQRITQQGNDGNALRQKRIVNTLPIATATVIMLIILVVATPLVAQLMGEVRPLYRLALVVGLPVLFWFAWDRLERFHQRVEGFLSLRNVTLQQVAEHDADEDRPAPTLKS
ncbi:MAG: cation:proton antiporter [SAR202 cluster bacterium]|nr:cation:proton antiporter [SAR202 cluster bacterium]